MTKKTKLLISSAAVSLVSILNHLYLASLHYKLKLGISEGQSLCNISSSFNCDTVAASPYSSLFGIPMAVLGASTHVILLLTIVVALLNISPTAPYYKRYSLFIGLFTAIVSLVMGFLSLSAVGSICLFCLFAYLLSFLNLGLLWKAQDESPTLQEAIGAAFNKAAWALILPIAIPALGWLGDKIVLDGYGLKKFNLMVQESVSYWQIAKTEEFDINKGLIKSGGDQPKMVIVEFADFLCPHCKRIAPTLSSFVKSRPDVKFVFKSFPLDGNCNEAIGNKQNLTRCYLPAAVYCSENMGQKGWQVKEYLFANQERYFRPITLDELSQEVATQTGLSSEELKKCIESDEMFDLLKALAKEGERAKISGTPSVFVNGKLLQRAQLMPVLEAAYKTLK